MMEFKKGQWICDKEDQSIGAEITQVTEKGTLVCMVRFGNSSELVEVEAKNMQLWDREKMGPFLQLIGENT